MYSGIYLVLRRWHFSRVSALFFASAFIVSPNSVLYENWLFYTYPVALLLVLAALALQRFEGNSNPSAAALFLGLIATLCLTRALYHLLYFAACALLILISRAEKKRQLYIWASLLFSIVLALYIKNLVLFGFFGASSWTGMNVFKIARQAAGPAMLDTLCASGEVPGIARQKPFSPLDTYPENYRTSLGCEDMPELSQERKWSGIPNYNHIAYIKLSDDYSRAAWTVISRHPRLYLAAVFDSGLKYCEPAWNGSLLDNNVAALTGYISALSSIRTGLWANLDSIYKRLFGVARTEPYPLTNLLIVPPILLIGACIAVAKMYRIVRYRTRDGIVYVFIAFTALYVALIGNTLEFGENNRFRVETDPLIFLLFVDLLRRGYRFVTRQRWKQGEIADGFTVASEIGTGSITGLHSGLAIPNANRAIYPERDIDLQTSVAPRESTASAIPECAPRNLSFKGKNPK